MAKGKLRNWTASVAASGAMMLGGGCDNNEQTTGLESQRLVDHLHTVRDTAANEAATNLLIDTTIEMLRYRYGDMKPIGADPGEPIYNPAEDKFVAIIDAIKMQPVRVQNQVYGAVSSASGYLIGNYTPSLGVKNKLMTAVDEMIAANQNVQEPIIEELKKLQGQIDEAIKLSKPSQARLK